MRLDDRDSRIVCMGKAEFVSWVEICEETLSGSGR